MAGDKSHQVAKNSIVTKKLTLKPRVIMHPDEPKAETRAVQVRLEKSANLGKEQSVVETPVVRSGVTLRTLTPEEKIARAHALGDARLREAEARRIAEEKARIKKERELIARTESRGAEVRNTTSDSRPKTSKTLMDEIPGKAKSRRRDVVRAQSIVFDKLRTTANGRTAFNKFGGITIEQKQHLWMLIKARAVDLTNREMAHSNANRGTLKILTLANEPERPKLSLTSTKTLTLKPPSIEQGVVRQNFTPGRTKAVVVERVKPRTNIGKTVSAGASALNADAAAPKEDKEANRQNDR